MEGDATAIEWDDETFEQALERVRTQGTIDAKGMRISREQLERILDAAPEDRDHPGRSLFKHASFEEATFQGGASFGGARFVHVAFDRARFAGTPDFMGATFEKGVSFSEASAEFGHFDFAHFGAGTRFDRMRIARGARFDRARFGDDTRFRQTEFGAARFLHAQFGEVAFQGASFGEASFAGSAFAGRPNFRARRSDRPALSGRASRVRPHSTR